MNGYTAGSIYDMFEAFNNQCRIQAVWPMSDKAEKLIYDQRRMV